MLLLLMLIILVSILKLSYIIVINNKDIPVLSVHWNRYTRLLDVFCNICNTHNVLPLDSNYPWKSVSILWGISSKLELNRLILSRATTHFKFLNWNIWKKFWLFVNWIIVLLYRGESAQLTHLTESESLIWKYKFKNYEKLWFECYVQWINILWKIGKAGIYRVFWRTGNASIYSPWRLTWLFHYSTLALYCLFVLDFEIYLNSKSHL